MGFFQLKQEQQINASLEEVWEFISSPQNLKKITPEYMGFDITSGNGAQPIYPGMIISYTVKPMLNIPMKWVTEITQVKENEFFIAEQRMGPYKMWNHQHLIKPNKDGVLMQDIVTYIPPMGVLGNMAQHLFIKKQLNQIFEHRTKVVNQLFNQ
jgi:ligand-binding SRPBCC domain-containing protein